jgi:hypothetical protein
VADYYPGLHDAGRYSGTGIIRFGNGITYFQKNILIAKKHGFSSQLPGWDSLTLIPILWVQRCPSVNQGFYAHPNTKTGVLRVSPVRI